MEATPTYFTYRYLLPCLPTCPSVLENLDNVFSGVGFDGVFCVVPLKEERRGCSWLVVCFRVSPCEKERLDGS